jgi:hypothetical protein
MLEEYRRGWVIGGAVVAVLVVLLGAYLVFGPGPKSDVTINAVPGDLTLKIDGKAVSFDDPVEVREGVHDLTAERSGFSPETRKFMVSKGDPLTIDLFLDANSPEGRKWFQDHPDAALEREAEAGREYEENARKKTARYPIVKKLPKIAKDFRLDYGISQAHPDDPTAVAFYIRTFTPLGRQRASEWLRSEGLDPATLELIYPKN